MQLFYTNEEFFYAGRSRPWIPFLCDSEMELLVIPNRYFLYVATVRGRTSSKNTWRTYANHLYEYFAFLEVNSMGWKDITIREIAAWRDSMLDRGCARSTVNQRIRGIQCFYTWTKHEGYLESTPFPVESVRSTRGNSFLAHASADGQRVSASVITLQEPTALPGFLTLQNAIKFVDSLSPSTSRLMGYLALLTGMRREEIIGLSYSVVPNPCGMDPKRSVPVILDAKKTPTKGQKTRTVMVPYALAVAMWNYFCEVWPRLNESHVAKRGVESQRFFLSVYGDPFSIRYLNNAFSKASRRSGIDCHPHLLRHTFATYELLRMTRMEGPTKALLWVRDRMGHSSILTTEIYVHTADLLKSSLVDGYQLEILKALADDHQTIPR